MPRSARMSAGWAPTHRARPASPASRAGDGRRGTDGRRGHRPGGGPQRGCPAAHHNRKGEPDMTQTGVITGASGGSGRATAGLCGERGAKVGLIARGRAGLEGAAREVEAGGGTALPIETDVADQAQVEAAAGQVEEKLGPIDVWVNCAF